MVLQATVTRIRAQGWVERLQTPVTGCGFGLRFPQRYEGEPVERWPILDAGLRLQGGGPRPVPGRSEPLGSATDLREALGQLEGQEVLVIGAVASHPDGALAIQPDRVHLLGRPSLGYGLDVLAVERGVREPG